MDPKRGTAEDVFDTESDADHVKKGSLKALMLVFLLFTAAAGLGFLITWQAFVFFELLVLVGCTVVLIQTLRRDHRVELHFEGSRLTIMGYTMQGTQKPRDYEVYDVSRSDFIIRQSKAEADLDYCMLTIKNTVFLFRGVKKCRELKEYIEQHFNS